MNSCAIEENMINFLINPFCWGLAKPIVFYRSRRKVPSKGVLLLGGRVRRFGVRLSYPLSFCDPASQPFLTKEPTNRRLRDLPTFYRAPTWKSSNLEIDKAIASFSSFPYFQGREESWDSGLNEN